MIKKIKIGHYDFFIKRARKRGAVESPGRPKAVVDGVEVRKLHEQGLSYRAIAKQMGVSASTVFKYANSID